MVANTSLQITDEDKLLPSALKAEHTRPVVGTTSAPLATSSSATGWEMKSWQFAPVSRHATMSSGSAAASLFLELETQKLG